MRIKHLGILWGMNNMNKLFNKIKNRYKHLYRNRKKGFTLLESIISIALFAIAGVILTMFVTLANNHIIGSYRVEKSIQNLNTSIATSKNNDDYNIVNNQDSTNNAADIGANKVRGQILIAFDEGIVIGPVKHNYDGSIMIEDGKPVPQYQNLGGENSNISRDIEITTSTQYGKDGKPIAQLTGGK